MTTKLLILLIIIAVALFLILIYFSVQSKRKKIVTEKKELIGLEGEVLEYSARRMLVQVQGEVWSAYSDAPLRAGEKIRVVKVADLLLKVAPI